MKKFDAAKASVVLAVASALVVALVVSRQNVVFIYSRSTLEMPLPLDDAGPIDISKADGGSYFNVNADYGYFSSKAATVANREVNRALEIVNATASNSNANSTMAPELSSDEPIEEISPFDKWSDPGGYRGILENPTTVLFNATSQKEICDSKCLDRPGWHPSDEVRKQCYAFCQSLTEATSAKVVKPQPRQHSWWLSKASAPGSEFVRYRSNAAATSAPATSLRQKTVGTMLFEKESYPHRAAVDDLNSFFDSLPTKSCLTADCNSPQQKTVVQVNGKAQQNFKPSQIREYERKVLGYHRKEEHLMAENEMRHIQAESGNIVSASMQGYNNLQSQAYKKVHQISNRHPSADADPHHVAEHSKAYDDATKQAGFVGYYDNVFADTTGSTMNGHAGNQDAAAVKSREAAPLKARQSQKSLRAKAGSLVAHKSKTTQMEPVLGQSLAHLATAVSKHAAVVHHAGVSQHLTQRHDIELQNKKHVSEIDKMRMGTMRRTSELLKRLNQDVASYPHAAHAAAASRPSVLRLTGREAGRLEELEEHADVDASRIQALLRPAPPS